MGPAAINLLKEKVMLDLAYLGLGLLLFAVAALYARFCARL